MPARNKNLTKLIICLLGGFFIRIVPFRAPNVEPILAILMPVSQVYGKLYAFLFGSGSILFYDLFTGTFGPWSPVTALTYGVIGVVAEAYFKARQGVRHYLAFAIIGTLLYDAVTGLSIGPIIFGQSFTSALYGQIPFTALHLAGNVALALFLSPLIYRFVAHEPKISDANILNFKKI